MRTAVAGVMICALLSFVPFAAGEEASEAELWDIIQAHADPTHFPETEDGSYPAEEALNDWSEEEAKRLKVLFGAGKQYLKEFPEAENAESVTATLSIAVQDAAGITGARAEGYEILELLKAKEGLPKDEAKSLYETQLMMLQLEGWEDAAALDRMGKAIGEFHQRYNDAEMAADLYFQAGAAAEYADQKKARPLFEQAFKLGSADVKARAEGVLRRYDLLGKPLQLQLPTLDGKEISLADLKGKVVLLDFWATWCMPCVEELPNLKQVYKKYHDKGFEIIGISLDDDIEALKSMVEEEEIPWPQHFPEEATGWESELPTKYGIFGIPTMWLIDKEGNVVDLDAQADLEAKVEKLL